MRPLFVLIGFLALMLLEALAIPPDRFLVPAAQSPPSSGIARSHTTVATKTASSKIVTVPSAPEAPFLAAPATVLPAASSTARSVIVAPKTVTSTSSAAPLVASATILPPPAPFTIKSPIIFNMNKAPSTRKSVGIIDHYITTRSPKIRNGTRKYFKALNNKAIQKYNQPIMELLLCQNLFFIRDTASSDEFSFDLPPRATGYYPIILSKLTGKTSSIFISSTSEVHVQLVKCGYTVVLGNVTSGNITFSTDGPRLLMRKKCGHGWKRMMIKLTITAVKGRARGSVNLNGKLSKGEIIKDLVSFSLGALTSSAIFFLALFCYCCVKQRCVQRVFCCGRKKKETTGGKWTDSRSFDYQMGFPNFPDGHFPLYRSISQRTVFEHETEDIQEEETQQQTNTE